MINDPACHVLDTVFMTPGYLKNAQNQLWVKLKETVNSMVCVTFKPVTGQE